MSSIIDLSMRFIRIFFSYCSYSVILAVNDEVIGINLSTASHLAKKQLSIIILLPFSGLHSKK